MERIYPKTSLSMVAHSRAVLSADSFSIITIYGEIIDVDSGIQVKYREIMAKYLSAPHTQYIPEILGIIISYGKKIGASIDRVSLAMEHEQLRTMLAYHHNLITVVSDRSLANTMYQSLEWKEACEGMFVLSDISPMLNRFFKTGISSLEIKEELRDFWSELYIYGLSAHMLGKRKENLMANAILGLILDVHYPSIVRRTPKPETEPSSSSIWKIAFDGVYGFGFSYSFPDIPTQSYEVRFAPHYLRNITKRLQEDLERLRDSGPEENIEMILNYLKTESPEYAVVTVDPIKERRTALPEEEPTVCPWNIFRL